MSAPVKKNSAPSSCNTCSTKSYLPAETPPIAVGLAMASRQPAWFAAPFYVVAIWKRNGRDEAIRRANDTEYGLTGSLYSRDRKRLEAEKKTRYAIQLELACETPSLAEAWKHDRPAGSMWLLSTQHAGRECFKVLWGRYPTLEAAKKAKAKKAAPKG